MIADKGSNDVTILLNQAMADGGFTFVPGPRLNLKTATEQGIGPVATAIVPSTTGGPSSLAVSLSDSNQVFLILGSGGGFFNDQNPTIFAVGRNPGPIFVGRFDSHPDLATINAGSNSLTLISNFTDSAATIQTVSTGGQDPVAAFQFNSGDGFDNLVVANKGDGQISLLQGSGEGLLLAASLSETALPSPTSVVFASLSGGQLGFYAATAGSESAISLAFSLNGGTLIPDFNGSAVLRLPSDTTGQPPFLAFPSGPDPVGSFALEINGVGQVTIEIKGDGGGLVTLQIGTEDTAFAFTSTLFTSDLPESITQALAAYVGEEVQLFVAPGQLDALSLLTKILVNSLPDIPPISPKPTPTPTNTPAQLVALSDSSLALVGALLIVSDQPSAGEPNLAPSESVAGTAVASFTTPGPPVAQPLSRQDGSEDTHDGGGGGEPFDPAAEADDAPAHPSSRAGSIWKRYLLGIDDEQEPQRPKARANPPSPAGDGPSVLVVPWRESSPMPETAAHPGRSNVAEAVDQALRTLMTEDTDSDRAPFPMPRVLAELRRKNPDPPTPSGLSPW